MSLFLLYRRVVVALCRLGFVLGALATTAMMFHIGADAVARNVFSSPLTGTLEVVSSWYMVALIFLPLGYIQIHRGHLIVELFTQTAREETRQWMDALMHGAAAFFLGIWTIPAIQLAMKKTSINESLDAVFFEVIVWPARWFMAVGMAVICLAFVLTFIEHLYHALRGESLEDRLGKERAQ